MPPRQPGEERAPGRPVLRPRRVHLVVVASADREECLGLGRGGEQRAPLGVRDRLVGVAVEHQQRRAQTRDLGQRVPARAEQGADAGEHRVRHRAHGGERRLEDDRARGMREGQVDGDGGAQRAAEVDHVLGGHALAQERGARAERVADEPRLRGRALAAPVSPVVVHEDADAELVGEQARDGDAPADVAAVAVGVEQGRGRAAGDQPAVQPHAVQRRERDVAEGKAHARRIGGERARGVIDEVTFHRFPASRGDAREGHEGEQALHRHDDTLPSRRLVVRSGRGGGTGMLSREDNEMLTLVDRSTPMGNAMRRYWMPTHLACGVHTSHAPILHRVLKADSKRPGFKPTHPFVRSKAPTLVVDVTSYGYQYASVRPLDEATVHIRTYQLVLPFHQIRPSQSEGGHALVSGHIWVPMDDESTMVYNWDYSETAPLTDDDRLERRLGNGPLDVDQRTFRSVRNKRNNYMLDRQVLTPEMAATRFEQTV